MENNHTKKADLKYLVALSHFPKFGPARLKKLKKHFSSWENAFNASLKNLELAGLDEAIAQEFISAKSALNPDEIMARLEKENIKTTVPEEDIYPKLLKEICDCPELLYYKGELPINKELNLAVVGTRKLTGYGKMVTENIIHGLAGSNLLIVSGLALGIDTVAHNAALETNLKTIGVLGSGLDKASIYPAQNSQLAERIIKDGGAIISEFPLGTPPLRQNFPQRNRLVAGMSLGTLVIEADIKSGALITARLALDYNREVMAVPGNINSQTSLGTNSLIKQGAKVVVEAKDILDCFNISEMKPSLPAVAMVPESKEEELIIAFLKDEPRHVNELVRLTKLDTSKINGTLVIMEMKGMVRNMGGMKYAINK